MYKRKLYIFLLVILLLCPVLMAAEPYAMSGGTSETPSEDSVLRTEADTFPVPVDYSYYENSNFTLIDRYQDIENLVDDALSFAKDYAGDSRFDLDYEYFVLYESNSVCYIYFYLPEEISKFYLKRLDSSVYRSLMYYDFSGFSISVGGVSYRTNFCVRVRLLDNDNLIPNFAIFNGGSDNYEIDWYFNHELSSSCGYCFSDSSLFSSYIPVYFTYNPDIVGLEGTYKLFKAAPAPEIPPGDYDIPVPDVEITDPDTAGLLSGIVQYFNAFLNVIAGFFTSIFYYFQELISDINNWFQNLIDNIVSLFDNLTMFLQDLFSTLNSILDDIYQMGLVNGSFSFSHFISVLVTPDFDAMKEALADLFNEHLGGHYWLQLELKVSELFDFFEGAFSDPESPVIVIPAGTYGSFVIERDILWTFDWYLDYKPTVDAIIAAFIYLFFFWRIVTSLPSIISGGASPFVGGLIAENKIDSAREHELNMAARTEHWKKQEAYYADRRSYFNEMRSRWYGRR